jgi:hypothetical protein
MQFQQNGLKQEAGKLVLISTNLLVICGKGKLAEQWNSQSLYLRIRKVIKQSAVIFKAYHFYQLHIKFHPTSFSQH